MTGDLWQDRRIPGVLDWLLEADIPAVRYLTMRDLLDRPADDLEMHRVLEESHRQGAIAEILSHMEQDGYWVKPGAGYNPKYRSTVWSIIMLAQIGASVEADERVAKACAYLLDHALTAGGQFSTNGMPSGTVDCLQGNLCWALLELGCGDPRLDTALEWMARTVTGEGIAPAEERNAAVRYYAYKCGPLFACGVNGGLPCAWGAAKVMLAFGRLPIERRTPPIQRAIDQGIAFLLSIDPADAAYPVGDGGKPSRNWWKFGFPVFYVTDLLQVAEALTRLGCGGDVRLANLISLIRGKQTPNGRWRLEYDYAGKTWVEVGKKNTENKWVTLRALRVLKSVITS